MPPSTRAAAAGILVAICFSTAVFIGASAIAAAKPPENIQVTGQHRGYTNDQLYIKLDNDKEMTFLVRIPGDKDAKWHDQFETLSRITVTYHNEPGEKFPIATAIKAAQEDKR